MTLLSKDGGRFEVKRRVAFHSETLKHMTADLDLDEAVPLLTIDSATLARVLSYCAAVQNEVHGTYLHKVARLDRCEHFAKLTKPTLFDVMIAADFLHIPVLLEDCCHVVATHIRMCSDHGLHGFSRSDSNVLIASQLRRLRSRVCQRNKLGESQCSEEWPGPATADYWLERVTSLQTSDRMAEWIFAALEHKPHTVVRPSCSVPCWMPRSMPGSVPCPLP